MLSTPDSEGDHRCGTFIVINRSGWIVTAKHILREADGDYSKLMWGWKDVSIDDVMEDSDSDMAIGRLTPFDGDWVGEYPVFCDPGEIVLGKTVGRLGYTMMKEDDQSSASIFQNIGIVARDYEEQGTRYFITSSPGIKGQSGGPIFDSRGRICGMQVSTRMADLGYRNMTDSGVAVPMRSDEGIGIHVGSLRKFLDAAGISYRIEG
ncbi:MAG: trypsin-like peptidase domain-containing protein [Candidatus Methanomethylophilaceae archaeon]|nr:trypsin-like peptidase domain-containing protein [Candidatus Methanomethylophilaceae archaeon]